MSRIFEKYAFKLKRFFKDQKQNFIRAELKYDFELKKSLFIINESKLLQFYLQIYIKRPLKFLIRKFLKSILRFIPKN